jgi:hypothetical protein
MSEVDREEQVDWNQTIIGVEQEVEGEDYDQHMPNREAKEDRLTFFPGFSNSCFSTGFSNLLLMSSLRNCMSSSKAKRRINKCKAEQSNQLSALSRPDEQNETRTDPFRVVFPRSDH